MCTAAVTRQAEIPKLLMSYNFFFSLHFPEIYFTPIKRGLKCYLEQNHRAPMLKENILQNFYRIQLFLREKLILFLGLSLKMDVMH